MPKKGASGDKEVKAPAAPKEPTIASKKLGCASDQSIRNGRCGYDGFTYKLPKKNIDETEPDIIACVGHQVTQAAHKEILELTNDFIAPFGSEQNMV